MNDRLRVTLLGLCILGSTFVDSPPREFPACYEDEAIVEVLSNFKRGEPYEFSRGELVCVPYDDINGGTRPEDRG